MALTKCRECGKEVSNKANACPHCGVKNPGVRIKDVLMGLAVVIGAIWLLTQCSSGDAEKTQAAASLAAPEKSLGLTVGQFTKQYNAAINAAEYRLATTPAVSKGEKFDSFSAQVTPYASIGGMVNKEDGSLREVMVISGNDGSGKRMAEQAIAMIGASKAVQPHRDPSDIMRQLTSMMESVGKKKNEPARTVSGNVLYTMTAPPGLGVWLVLSVRDPQAGN